MPIVVEISAEMACFTRPEFRTERRTYDIATASAIRGAVESVYRKPQFTWVVKRIEIMNPIAYETIKRCEIKLKQSPRRGIKPIATNAERDLRYTTFLKNVRYRVTLDLILNHDKVTPGREHENTKTKHLEMLARRLKNNQSFHTPYLGLREFIASVKLVDDITEQPVDVTFSDVQLYDFEYGETHRSKPIFVEYNVINGVCDL